MAAKIHLHCIFQLPSNSSVFEPITAWFADGQEMLYSEKIHASGEFAGNFSPNFSQFH